MRRFFLIFMKRQAPFWESANSRAPRKAKGLLALRQSGADSVPTNNDCRNQLQARSETHQKTIMTMEFERSLVMGSLLWHHYCRVTHPPHPRQVLLLPK